ncbi:hypothetical protein J6590_097770, partial [Homalodisca vitripennis]
ISVELEFSENTSREMPKQIRARGKTWLEKAALGSSGSDIFLEDIFPITTNTCGALDIREQCR